MESAQDWHSARALLEWQVDLGVTEAICDAPINRYELVAKQPKPAATKPTGKPTGPAVLPGRVAEVEVDYVARAREAAARSSDLDGLHSALKDFDGCELKKGARNTVFSGGNPAARVMVIGEAPGRDEDIAGKPFVGRAGQLLDRMFAAINMGRDAPLSKDAIYITNVMPWRPPQNREPTPQEMAMMVPFVERHVQLDRPRSDHSDGQHPVPSGTGQTRHHPDARRLGNPLGQTRAADVPPCVPLAQPRRQTRGVGGFARASVKTT